MKLTKVLQEARKMKFEELYELRTEKRLSIDEAALMLGVSPRTFYRYIDRYKEDGLDGLDDKRLGHAAHNAAPVDEVINVSTLYTSDYQGYNMAHFYDEYRRTHKGGRSYNWVRKSLQKEGVVVSRKKRGRARIRRPRAPMKGMMLHQDGSTHQWIEGIYWDLIVTMDDADNEIYSAFFVDEEGTWSSLEGVREVIVANGLFCSLYTDRGSHYWYTPGAGKKVDKENPTQFRRALQALGIQMIAAYSPEARGRSERMFRTLQGRLPQALKSAGITTMGDANQFLKETFIRELNERFIKTPVDGSTQFTVCPHTPEALGDIMCLHTNRVVKKDNTVSYRSKDYQLPTHAGQSSYAKATVTVHEYEDGTLKVFYGPKKVASFSALESQEEEREAHWSEVLRGGNMQEDAVRAA